MSGIASTTDKNSLRPIRRCVRKVNETPDGIIQCATKSFTNNKDEWHPNFDLHTGAVFCDCHDFHYRCAKENPTINSAATCLCKHLIFGLLGAIRRGELVVTKERRDELDAASQRKKGFSKTSTTTTTTTTTDTDYASSLPNPSSYYEFLALYGADEQTASEEDVMLTEAWNWRKTFHGPDLPGFEQFYQQADAIRHQANDAWLREVALVEELLTAKADYERLCEEVEEDTDYQAECRIHDLGKRIEELTLMALDPAEEAPFPALLPTC